MKLDKIAKRMIVIEGIDGSGKSSVVNELIKYIRTDENITRIIEPSHNVIGSLIREMIIGDDMSDSRQRVLSRLFSADREANLGYIKERLKGEETSEFFLYDRYMYSTMAYQNTDLDKKLNEDFPTPGLTIFLDTDVDVALKRITDRGDERQVFETKERLTMIRDRYHEVLPEDCVKISTNGKTIKEVVGECYVIIMKYILSVHRVEPSSEEYQL